MVTPDILIIDSSPANLNHISAVLEQHKYEKTIKNGPQTSAKAMLEHLKLEVANFVGHTEPHDDMTIMVIQV